MPGAGRQRPVVIVISDSESESEPYNSDDDGVGMGPKAAAAAPIPTGQGHGHQSNAAPGPGHSRVTMYGSVTAHDHPISGRNLATTSLAPVKRRRLRTATIPSSQSAGQEQFAKDDEDMGNGRNGVARLSPGVQVGGATMQFSEPIIDITQADTVLPLIIEIIPDVCPDHALKYIKEQIQLQPSTRRSTAARVIEIIYENFPYPTIAKGRGERKRKRSIGDGEERDEIAGGGSKRHKDEIPESVDGVINYQSCTSGLEERKGKEYLKRALRTLENTFPHVPRKYIRSTYNMCNNLYVPTHFELARQADLPADKRDYKRQERPRIRSEEVSKRPTIKLKGKGKAKAHAQLSVETMFQDQLAEGSSIMVEDDMGERAFMVERAWLISFLTSQDGLQPLEYIKLICPPETGYNVECQCCFDDEFVQCMVQCEEGHLFCRECVKRLIDNAIGEHKIVHCMDGSGCKAIFPVRELKKAVIRRTLEVYHNILQRKELEAAGIQGLESCPACEYAVVIENENEKLFRCEMEDCGLVSCRACRREDHIPKSCEEAQKDRKLDTRHTVEEAMTEALVRICPNSACNQTFIKEFGCNKITCTKCHKTSCYVCRALITDGYAHFDSDPLVPYNGKSRDSTKCRLWDPRSEDVYAADVARARGAAQDRIRAAAAEVGEAIEEPDIDVALPEARDVRQFPDLAEIEYRRRVDLRRADLIAAGLDPPRRGPARAARNVARPPAPPARPVAIRHMIPGIAPNGAARGVNDMRDRLEQDRLLLLERRRVLEAELNHLRLAAQGVINRPIQALGNDPYAGRGPQLAEHRLARLPRLPALPRLPPLPHPLP